MFGLGWSWPGNFDDYPMMRLAKPFEARWLRSSHCRSHPQFQWLADLLSLLSEYRPRNPRRRDDRHPGRS